MKAMLAVAAFMTGLGLSDRWPEIWTETWAKNRAALADHHAPCAPPSCDVAGGSTP